MLQQTSHATALSEVQSVGNAALSCGQSRLAVGHIDEETQSYGAVSPVSFLVLLSFVPVFGLRRLEKEFMLLEMPPVMSMQI